jgi:hypothetical protein
VDVHELDCGNTMRRECMGTRRRELAVQKAVLDESLGWGFDWR